ncbi:MAG: KTSC domain-containing protein [Lachnospiraceae bacterium]|nr:KTSC domain-containing protein [Lachnospiraceae bacterium]
MEPVSSAIAKIDYNPDVLILRITFTDGRIYEYYGVPLELANLFMSAPSKGKFYTHNIRGHFNQQRIL